MYLPVQTKLVVCNYLVKIDLSITYTHVYKVNMKYIQFIYN